MGGKNRRLGLTTKQVSVIRSEFAAEEIDRVAAELRRVQPTHTMDSEYNLNNTIDAILQLSRGDAAKLSDFVDTALRDFRDLIYWATLEQ